MDGQTLSAVKLALQARQLREQAGDAGLLQSDPLAIVGLACRFPGGATSPEKFWDLLARGVDAITEVPRDRFDVEALFDPDPAAPGKVSTKWGGFIENIDQFDPRFFGISPREAASMDPQQRLLLEVAWEALEDAGLTQEMLAGSQTGVFVGVYGDDYRRSQMSRPSGVDAYTVLGTAHCTTCGRLSFLLDLLGPSLVVDTGCSSSLVAVHLAAQSLRAGECRVALAAGVGLILSPEMTISLSKWGFMAADGRCKTFDARADGFVRGEGCGVVVIKRLSDALADRDRVLAILRGTAVNEDGRSTVLTAPSGTAQQAVVRQALANARVAAAEVTYVEAHGTGTALGDPIEVEALAEVLGQPVDGPPCYVASAKSNLGHLEASAGVAGLIKTVLALQYEHIPPHLHLQALNPHIELDGTRLRISREGVPWPAGPKRRFAGVSSFGFGGTNAHVILEDAPQLPPVPAVESSALLLPVSARSPEALAALARSYAAYLRAAEAPPIADVCFTASIRRTHHEYRAVAAGDSAAALAQALESVAAGEPRWDVSHGRRPAGSRPGPVFVFSGQGPQWWAMGRELQAVDAQFRHALETIAAAMDPVSGWSLLEVLGKDEAASPLGATEFAQPAIFALQVALAGAMRARGVDPAALVGHSVGEIAAAHVGGALDLDQAVRIVVHRGRVMQRATGRGRMAAVAIDEARARALVAEVPDRLSLAAINAPRSVVLSGDGTAVAEAVARLEREGVTCRMLPVNYAFHSYQMAELAGALREGLGAASPRTAALPILSTVTGLPADARSFDAEYWVRNLTQPVRFSAALGWLAANGYDTFVEVAPHPVLAASIEETLAASHVDGAVVTTLRRGRPELPSLLSAIGRLHVTGHAVDWSRVAPRGRVVSLPAYAWQRERYWLEAPAAPIGARSDVPAPSGSLVGTRVRSPGIKDAVFETRISASSPAWLADHRIHGAVLVPATAMLAMAHGAARQIVSAAGLALADVAFEQPLAVGDEPRLVQVVLEHGPPPLAFRILSLEDEDADRWTTHAVGRVVVDSAAPEGRAAREAGEGELQARTGAELYADFTARGCVFGPAFRLVERVRADGTRSIADVAAPAAGGETSIAPAVLDACFHALQEVLPPGADTFVPVRLRRFRPHGALGGALRASLLVTDAPASGETRTVDLTIADTSGRVLVDVEGLEFRRTTGAALQGSGAVPDGWLYAVDWVAAPEVSDAVGPARRWVIACDAQGVGDALARELRALGHDVHAIRADDAGVTRPEVETGSRQAWTGVLADRQGSALPLGGVIHLQSLDSPGIAGQSSARVQQTVQRLSASMLAIGQALVDHDEPGAGVWLVTRGSQHTGAEAAAVDPCQAPAWAMGRVLALEHPEVPCRRVDLDPASGVAAATRLAREILGADGEPEVAVRMAGRFVARLRRVARGASGEPAKPVALAVPSRGTLDSLTFVPLERRQPGRDEIEVRVRATGLNFRDVLNALDMYAGPVGAPGIECSGVVAATGAGVTGFRVGDAVVGLAPECFATYVVAAASRFAHKPERLSFAEAVTIPSAFMTARHALEEVGKLRRGERVLVHAGAGGVGLAAIQVAQRLGAEVFATAGSDEKRAWLASLGVSHVMSSRTIEFADQVMAATGGRGVDLVLNSLAGEFIPRSLSVVAPDGRFVEIGRSGIWDAARVAESRPDVQYSVIFLLDLFDEDASRGQRLLGSVLADAAAGKLSPLPATVYPLSRTVDAFRHMAQARHIGKIVVTQESTVHPGTARGFEAGAYVVTGGFGALGLHVARALAEGGATHLVLVGRRAPSPEAGAAISGLEALGAVVRPVMADVARVESIEAIRTALGDLPPLRGVVHAAGVLRDGVWQQQTAESLDAVLSPKVAGVLNMLSLADEASPDFFVMFSGGAAMLGSPGQANYAAANAFLDACAWHRFRHAKPGLAIDWSAWGQAGMAAQLGERDRRRFAERGMAEIPPARGAAAFTYLALRAPAPQVGVLPIDWPRYAEAVPAARPLLSLLLEPAADEARQASPAVSFADSLRAAPAAARPGLVMAFVRERALKVLGLPPAFLLDAHAGLRDVGLDSLMAVELRNVLQAAVGQPLPATLAFDHPTVAALARYLLSDVLQLGAESSPAPAVEGVPGDALSDVHALSDEEAEAQLAAELASLRRADAYDE
jgi:acyl transferase domain-containing protein/NADPH:quinone reductase-like Zn-dependent oxidoreductase